MFFNKPYPTAVRNHFTKTLDPLNKEKSSQISLLPHLSKGPEKILHKIVNNTWRIN